MFHDNDTESIVCISMTSAVALSAISDFSGDLQTIQIEVGQINEIVTSPMSVLELPSMRLSSKLNAFAKDFYPVPEFYPAPEFYPVPEFYPAPGFYQVPGFYQAPEFYQDPGFYQDPEFYQAPGFYPAPVWGL